MGTKPLDVPFVPQIEVPFARMQWTLSPMPPADFEIKAHCSTDLKMPSIESAVMVKRKQDDSCGRFVAAAKSVGDA